MNATSERLPRLLALVPYLLARPGVPVDDAAADFGVTPKQLRRDLELLWMCGLPGYGPGDLIDLSFDSDTITVTYDAGMRRPLRLTAAEATSLLVALRALADSPGLADTDAVQRGLAKIEAAVGQAQPAGVVVGLGARRNGDPEIQDTVREATSSRRALRLRYYTASRDEITDRTVDPMRLLLVEGRSYLEAWCRRASSVRLFRLDRIDRAELLDEPAAPPPHAEPTDVSAGLFQPEPNQRTAQLVLHPDAHWVAEYYAVDDVAVLGDARTRIRMRYADDDWMVRLVVGLGDKVQVEEPVELAEQVRDRAAAALRRAGRLPDGWTE